MSLNVVMLMGNLTRDVEIRYTPSGVAVAEFGLAMNEVFYNDRNEKIEKVCFVDCTAWKEGAEWAGKHLSKGAMVHVTGKLVLDQWDDKTTGEKRSKLKVVVQKFTPTFATWKDRAPSDEGHSTQPPSGYRGRSLAPQEPPPRRPAAPPPKQRDPDLDMPDDDPSDIPF